MAYDVDSITISQVVRAIAHFERSLVSVNSKYDQVTYLQEGRFSETQKRGEAVFMAHCGRCHTPPHFTDHDFHNNGIDHQLAYEAPLDPRWGRYRITGDAEDIGK
jgi:cytochrome c peroxidase